MTDLTQFTILPDTTLTNVRTFLNGESARVYGAELSYGALDRLSDRFAALLIDHGIGIRGEQGTDARNDRGTRRGRSLGK